MVMNWLSKLFKSESSEIDASSSQKVRKSSGYFMELAEDPDSTSVATEHVTRAVEPPSPKPSELVANTAPIETEKAAKAKAPTPVKAKSAKLTEPTSTPSEPVKTPEGMTFAPNFLLSPDQNGGRRRPGPSLNPFMDMANQVQTKSE